MNFLLGLNMLATTVDGTCEQIPAEIKNLVSTIIMLVRIIVPILLIIFGMIDLGKAVVAQDEDAIKKGQQTLIKRAIAAVIVFFVVILVQLVVNLAAGSDSDTLMACVNQFVNGVSETKK